MSATMTKRLGAGRYTITRQDDGAAFSVILGLNGRWIVESANLQLDDFPTMKQARIAIGKRWTPQARGMSRANAWEIAMGMHGYTGSAAEKESRQG